MDILYHFIQIQEEVSDMKTVRIMLDVWAGPIWGCTYDEEKNEYDYEIELISQDKELMKVHQEIQNLYNSYYHFEYKSLSCYFDEEQEKKDKDKMLYLLERLINRLNEINDASFVIDDRETERIKNL